GRPETGSALYARVLADLGNNSRMRQPLLWNHGWDLYRAGDAAAALARWKEAGIDTYNNPSWVPPTLALGLWALDRREEAVQWYAAAVRTEPTRWRDPANLPALPDWREEDRAKLAEVAAAWAEAPPGWPQRPRRSCKAGTTAPKRPRSGRCARAATRAPRRGRDAPRR